MSLTNKANGKTCDMCTEPFKQFEAGIVISENGKQFVICKKCFKEEFLL